MTMRILSRIFPAAAVMASLICVSSPLAVHAQSTDSAVEWSLPGELPGSRALLLGSERVRAELGLTSGQRAQLDSIRMAYRSEARKLVGSVDESAQSRKQTLMKLNAVTGRFDRRAMAVLNADQRARLYEVEAQVLGGYVLLSRSVQQQLELTKDQKLKLAKIHAAGQKFVSEVNGWYEAGEVSGYERLLYLREDRESRSDSMLGVLTAAQRAEVEKLAGEPFRA